MKRVVLLLIILAGGYWVYHNRLWIFPQPAPKEIAPQRWQISRASGTVPNASLTIVENATNSSETNASLEDNATVAEVPADTVFSHDFVRNLAGYLVQRYQPAQTKRNPTNQGRLELNIKSANIHFAVDMPGMIVDKADPLKARKLVFGHFLNEKTLEFFHTVYTPFFLDTLDASLADVNATGDNGWETPLNETQRKELYTLLGARIRAVGQTVAALARETSVAPLVSKYLEAAERVNEAHFSFWNLQNQNASEVVMDEASAQIKFVIQAREMSKQRLLQTIVAKANPQGLDASELIYLAQWIYRRGQESPEGLPLVAKGGELLVKTAAALEVRAQQPLMVPADNSTVQ